MTSIRKYSSSTAQSSEVELQSEGTAELQAKGVTQAIAAASTKTTTAADAGSTTGAAGTLYTGGVAEPVQAYNVNAKSVTSGASFADLGTVKLSGSSSSAVDGDTGLGVTVTRSATSSGTTSSAQLETTDAALTVVSSSGTTSTTTTTGTATATTNNTASYSSSYTEINDAWLLCQQAMAEETSNLSDLRKQIKTTWSSLRETSEKIVEAQDSLNNVKSSKGHSDNKERAMWQNTINELKRDAKELVESLDNLQESLKEGVANLKSLSDQGKELKEQTEDLEEQAGEEYADGTIDKATYQKIEKLNSSMESELTDADEAIETYQELADANEFDADALYSACAETYDSNLNADGTTLATSAGSYNVSDYGSNVVAFMDYLDSYEAAVDTGSDTKDIASDRYEGKLKT